MRILYLLTHSQTNTMSKYKRSLLFEIRDEQNKNQYRNHPFYCSDFFVGLQRRNLLRIWHHTKLVYMQQQAKLLAVSPSDYQFSNMVRSTCRTMAAHVFQTHIKYRYITDQDCQPNFFRQQTKHSRGACDLKDLLNSFLNCVYGGMLVIFAPINLLLPTLRRNRQLRHHLFCHRQVFHHI